MNNRPDVAAVFLNNDGRAIERRAIPVHVASDDLAYDAGTSENRDDEAEGVALRGVLLLAVGLLLCGCTDADWDHAMTYDAPAAPAPQAPNAAAAANYSAFVSGAGKPAATEKCARAATERRSDIEAQGFDETLQQQAYNKTYADCMAWSARSGMR